MAFWGRTKEQKKIQDMLLKKAQDVTLIFGRRRVGKSELIKACL